MLVIVLMHLKGYSQNDVTVFRCIFPTVATFPGGEKALLHFIYNNFVQPDAVPDSTFCKTGIVKFVIDKNGVAGQFETEQCLGYNCDAEIIRILRLTKWKPALFEGKPCNDTKRLPYTILFVKSEPVNSNTSPQSAPACPPQMPLAKYVLWGKTGCVCIH